MQIINYLNQISPDIFNCISAAILIAMMLLMLKLEKLNGLYIYICVALIACNIQVMKGSMFFFSKDVIPLGTLTYGTISIAIGIISEFYGFKAAKKTIILGFLANIMFNVVIFMTLGYKPLDEKLLSNDLKFLAKNHQNMLEVFNIMPLILISGLIAYFCSEYITAFLQVFFKKVLNKKFLSARTYAANTIGAFVDLIIMNYLAWFFFNPKPLGIKIIFFSYILSAYPFRLFTAFLSIPTIKIAGYIINKSKKNDE